MATYPGFERVPPQVGMSSPPPSPLLPPPDNDLDESPSTSIYQQNSLTPGLLAMSYSYFHTTDNCDSSENCQMISQPQPPQNDGNGFVMTSPVTCSMENDPDGHSAEKAQSASTSNNVLYCKLCDKQCTDINLVGHTSGMKHCRNFLTKQSQLGFDTFDELYGDVPFTKTLSTPPPTSNVKERYALHAYRSGLLNKFTCQACAEKTHVMTKWYEHVYGWKHGNKMLSLRSTVKPEVFWKQFGDLPGPNPTLFPAAANWSTFDGGQADQAKESIALINKSIVLEPSVACEAVTSTIEGCQHTLNKAFPVHSLISATSSDGQSTNRSCVTSSKVVGSQLSAQCSSNYNNNRAFSPTTCDDCNPTITSTGDLRKGQPVIRQRTLKKRYQKNDREHHKIPVRRTQRDSSPDVSEISQKLPRQNCCDVDSCDILRRRLNDMGMFDCWRTEAMIKRELRANHELGLQLHWTDSSSDSSYSKHTVRRQKLRKKRRSNSHRMLRNKSRGNVAIVKKFKKILTISDDEEHQSLLRETLYDFVGNIVGRVPSTEMPTGVNAMLLSAMSRSDQIDVWCIYTVTGERNFLSCHHAAQLLRSIDDDLMITLAWFLARDKKSCRSFNPLSPSG